MTQGNGKSLRVAVAAFFAGAFLVSATGQAAPTSADSSERAADPRDKVVCKRFVRTGSLADSYRTCKTKWEWERERENLRQLNAANSCRATAEAGSC